eukprot:5049432-Prorocentrum_lima.AAC.1
MACEYAGGETAVAKHMGRSCPNTFGFDTPGNCSRSWQRGVHDRIHGRHFLDRLGGKLATLGILP